MNMLIFVGVLATVPVENPRTFLLAGQLAGTMEESEDGANVVALNVLPLVLEWAMFPRVGVRAFPILNLQLANNSAALAHRGAGLTVPLYLAKMPSAHYRGVYAGPHAAFTTNPLAGGSDLTLSAEAGYRFQLGRDWHFNLAFQFGATRLDRPAGSEWVQHVGLYPSVGAWVL